MLTRFSRKISLEPDIGCSAPSHSHQNTSLRQCYKKNEQEKKRKYDQHVREMSMDPCFFNIRRNGTNSQCGLQKNSFNDCQTRRTARPSTGSDASWATHSCTAQQLCA